ncbi:MAG: AsnC family transcriptional regulator [Actinomycetota bacterium]
MMGPRRSSHRREAVRGGRDQFGLCRNPIVDENVEYLVAVTADQVVRPAAERDIPSIGADRRLPAVRLHESGSVAHPAALGTVGRDRHAIRPSRTSIGAARRGEAPGQRQRHHDRDELPASASDVRCAPYRHAAPPVPASQTPSQLCVRSVNRFLVRRWVARQFVARCSSSLITRVGARFPVPPPQVGTNEHGAVAERAICRVGEQRYSMRRLGFQTEHGVTPEGASRLSLGRKRLISGIGCDILRPVDLTDRLIVTELAANSCLSMSDLAAKVNLSRSHCYRRVASQPPPPDVLSSPRTESMPGKMDRQARTVLSITAILIGLSVLAAWSLVDPHADIPVVSRIMCSLKGGSWYDGSAITGPAGCYNREPTIDFLRGLAPERSTR